MAGNTAVTLACKPRPVEPAGRPRVGLALGGGGARGIAHISVLRQLEAMHVPVDCIAGTSMGALVGAMYASGMASMKSRRPCWPRLAADVRRFAGAPGALVPAQARRRAGDFRPVSASAKGVKVAGGLLAGERILLLFEKLVEPVSTIEDFDRLPIPYRAVAADINNGEPVVIGRRPGLGDARQHVVPGVFPPVQMGERILVDGGIARNMPIDVVRDMGADIIIAVDVGTPLAKLTAVPARWRSLARSPAC